MEWCPGRGAGAAMTQDDTVRDDTVRDDAENGAPENGHRASQLGYNPEGGTLVAEARHRGHVLSWVTVVLVIAGFMIGGIGLTLGVNMAMVWIGVAAVVAGGLLGAVSDIFADVVLDSPRVLPELAHTTRKGRARLRTTGAEGGHTMELAEGADKPRLT